MTDKLAMMVISADERLGASLAEVIPTRVSVSHAVRPSAAIRAFDGETPDTVVIDIGAKPEQAALTVEALRARPIGALVPIFLVETLPTQHLVATPSGARQAGADHFFASTASARSILKAAASAVAFDLGDFDEDGGADERPLLDEVGPTVHRQLAELEHPAATEQGAPTPIHSPVAGRRPVDHPVDADAIRRKLRQVRHEDYFTILDLRKSADAHRITQAYGQLRRRFDPSSVAPSVVDQHHREVKEICDALDDAYGVLGSEPLRTQYLRALLEAIDSR